MITAWMAAKGFLGLKNGFWVLIAALIAAGSFTLIAIANNAVEDTLDTAKTAGRSQAESEGKSVTLDQNRKANDAEDEVRRGGPAATDGCLSNARGDSAGCERFGN